MRSRIDVVDADSATVIGHAAQQPAKQIFCFVAAEDLLQAPPPPTSHGSAMTYLLPPLNALRAFEAAARHLSFKLAAQELHVTAGAVAQQVRGLEAQLGCTLF